MDRRLKYLLSDCTFKADSAKCAEGLKVAQWPAAHEKGVVILSSTNAISLILSATLQEQQNPN